jgi:hypothetical protein
MVRSSRKFGAERAARRVAAGPIVQKRAAAPNVLGIPEM